MPSPSTHSKNGKVVFLHISATKACKLGPEAPLRTSKLQHGLLACKQDNLSLRCQNMTEDDLSISKVRTWTRHGKLVGVSLLRFFDTSLHCRDMTEDDLSIFQVRTWTQHGKLGGSAFYSFLIQAFVDEI